MTIEHNKSLLNYNSFGFDISAEYFTAVNSTDALHAAIQWSKQRKLPFFILGGGSNIVFTKDVEGLVIHMAMRGISTVANNHNIRVKVAAGEPWHSLVESTLGRGIFGLENLALIPGLAGAAPIQNIGAYGVEVCDYLHSVDAYDIDTGNEISLSTAACRFAYRDSIFKSEIGKRYIVTALQLNLSTIDAPTITYTALTDRLSARDIHTPTARQVFETVCAIRREKLPDPATIGNAGSFFKNPLIPRHLFDTLKASYPDMPGFREKSDHYKVPAAWLIDHAGWKGRRFDQIGVHNAQALVLVNHGGGNGQQIAMLANKIKTDILQRYGVHLEREPSLY